MAEPGPTITLPVRLVVGDVRVVELGVITVALATLTRCDPDGSGRIVLGLARDADAMTAELAALLDHAARALRKGTDSASPRTG